MKREKKLNFIVPLVIYPFDVMVSVGQSDDELKESLSKFNCEWDESMSYIGNGRFIINENNQSIIRLANYPETYFELGVLAHEIFHCVTHVLNRIGMKFILYKSDEAYSYLIGYLTEEIYNKLKIKQ